LGKKLVSILKDLKEKLWRLEVNTGRGSVLDVCTVLKSCTYYRKKNRGIGKLGRMQ